MANDENLIPLSERTKREQREIASKGGKASVKARAEKKTLKETLLLLLEAKQDLEGKTLTGYEAVCLSLFAKALAGDVNAFKELRDTIGEKPVSTVDINTSEAQAELREYMRLLKKGG